MVPKTDLNSLSSFVILLTLLIIIIDIRSTTCAELATVDTLNERRLKGKETKPKIMLPPEDEFFPSVPNADVDFYLGNKVENPSVTKGNGKPDGGYLKGRKRKQRRRHRHHKRSKKIERVNATDWYESLMADLPVVDPAELEPPVTTTTTMQQTTLPNELGEQENLPTTPSSKESLQVPLSLNSSKLKDSQENCSSSSEQRIVNLTRCTISTQDNKRETFQMNKNGPRKIVLKIPEVHTKRGRFRGRLVNVNGSEVYAFYGIPYADQPIGKLRFKIPFPLKPTSQNSIIDASFPKSRCFPTKLDDDSARALYYSQGNLTENNTKYSGFSESCLNLNVWIPKPKNLKTLAPVLVWLHGEGFMSGSKFEDYDTVAGFVAMTSVVVVSIQYRLGVFGFLFFGNSDAPGNMGFFDQLQALRWIEEHIQSFGGNPNAVTLMGDGMGAAHVGFHLISKTSPSFFRNAIMIGGAPTQPQVFRQKREVFNASLEISAKLGCTETGDIAECLMKLDPLAIWKVQSLFYSNTHNALSFPFVMTDDGFVIETTPIQLLEKGRGKKGNVLLGVAENPGSALLLELLDGVFNDKPTFISYDKFFRVMTHLFRNYNPLERDFIVHQYKSWHNLEDGYANQLRIADAIGDHFFVCPMRKFADHWAARGLSTHFFTFSQKSTSKKRAPWMGVVHGDELEFLFGVPIHFPGNYRKDEVLLSKAMLKVLETFIKSGEVVNEWERYGQETPSYLDFNWGSGPPTNHFGPRGRECNFWNELLPELRTGESSAMSEN